jgi:hypothetical protein
VRGRENVLKRQLIHVGAFNLSLISRQTLGAGTPRELRNRQQRSVFIILVLKMTPWMSAARSTARFLTYGPQNRRFRRLGVATAVTKFPGVTPRTANRTSIAEKFQPLFEWFCARMLRPCRHFRFRVCNRLPDGYVLLSTGVSFPRLLT